MGEPTPDPRKALRLVTVVMVASSGFFLGLAYLLHRQMGPTGPPLVAWIAVGVAVVSPALAATLRGEGLVGSGSPAARPGEPDRRLPRLIFFAVLEGAVFLCAAALLVAPSPWPLAAGLLPLVVMLLNLPDAGA